jgi:hypothetical protein
MAKPFPNTRIFAFIIICVAMASIIVAAMSDITDHRVPPADLRGSPTDLRGSLPIPVEPDYSIPIKHPRGISYLFAPSVSQDHNNYFIFSNDVLVFGPLVSDSETHSLEGHVLFSSLVFGIGVPYQWASNSQSIYGVQQETERKSGGWATSQLSTVLISIDGSIRPLPPLQHPAGPLDGLLWVGNDGLALAQFGVRGDDYRPKHHDPEPTLAMVDAVHGQVLQASAIPVIERPGALPVKRIRSIDARLDKNGQMYALFLISNAWFEWHQGEDMRPVAMPFGKAWPLAQFTIAPDLINVLVMHNLSAYGPICEGGKRLCPPPEPRSGTIASLHDIRSGRTLWEIKGKATDFSRSQKPAISTDGAYALINMPPDQGQEHIIALISMDTGKIIKTIKSYGNFGFTSDGHNIWASEWNSFKVYSIVE